MYESPPASPGRVLLCPACGAQVDRIWQPACSACGVEFRIDAPWWLLVLVLTIALASMTVGVVVLELVRLWTGSGLAGALACLPIGAGWMVLNLRMVSRWGRLAVKR